jgi:hypothetical protein
MGRPVGTTQSVGCRDEVLPEQLVNQKERAEDVGFMSLVQGIVTMLVSRA